MMTPELSTWSRMSSREVSGSASSDMIVGERSDMVTYKRVRRPWSAAINAALVVPGTRILPQGRFQLLAVGFTYQQRAVPDQARLTRAGLAAWTVRNCHTL